MERRASGKTKKRVTVHADVVVTRWDREDPPSEHELYGLMQQEGLFPYLRGEPAGTRKPMHAHPFAETLWVVSGWVRYRFPALNETEGYDVILKAGDRIALPAAFAHETDVEGAAYLVYLTNSPYALGVTHQPTGVNI